MWSGVLAARGHGGERATGGTETPLHTFVIPMHLVQGGQFAPRARLFGMHMAVRHTHTATWSVRVIVNRVVLPGQKSVTMRGRMVRYFSKLPPMVKGLRRICIHKTCSVKENIPCCTGNRNKKNRLQCNSSQSPPHVTRTCSGGTCQGGRPVRKSTTLFPY